MNFRFEWYNSDQTAIAYIVEGKWNWNDFHTCVRSSLYTMHQHPHQVDSVIDLRASEGHVPAGIRSHSQAFGKRLSPALSGKAIVIGLNPEQEARLQPGPERRLTTQDGQVFFVDSPAEADALLATWLAARSG